MTRLVEFCPGLRPCASRSALAAIVLAASLGLGACASVPESNEPASTRTASSTPAASTPTASVEPESPKHLPEHTIEPHDEWAEAILYFVVLDRFADGDPANNVDVDETQKGHFHGGDLVGLRQRLDDLAELGVTAIWITPVVKNIPGFVTGAGFRDYGYHGYWADDFYSIDPRFGTEAELKELVDAAHARGIAILLDVVYNHVGYESSYTKDPKFRAWLRSAKPGGCGGDDLTQCLAGLPDLETERPEVRDYLFEAHLGLAERVGLDGFRLDTVKHVEHDFWQEHRRRVDERLGEDFFLLGEVWGGDPKVLDPWFEPGELDAGFDFAFQGSTLAFVQGRGRPVAFGRFLEKRHEVREGHHLAHYLGSHDVPTALYQLDGDVDAFRLAVFLQMTVSGIPTIYYGEEVGRVGGDWPENRSDMPWGDLGVEPGDGLERDEALRDFYEALIDARREHPALWRGDHETVAFDADWLAFLRSVPADDSAGDDSAGDVLVVVHRGRAATTAAIDLPASLAESLAESSTGERRLVDVLTGDTFAVAQDAAEDGADGRIEVAMPPLSGRVLVADQPGSTRNP